MLSLGLVIYSVLMHSDHATQNLPLHMASDIALISGLSLLAGIVNRKALSFALLPMGIALMLVFHAVYMPLLERADKETIKLDSSTELLVEFSNKAALQKWISENSGTYSIKYPVFEPLDQDISKLDEYLGIDIPDTKDAKKIYKQIRKYEQVVHIEWNELMALNLPSNENVISEQNAILNDPLVVKQWAINEDLQKYYHSSVSSRCILEKKDYALLAILDTGIDAIHEDLQKNYISIQKKYDSDPRGHGTHCAGIASAVSQNGIGIASLWPACTKARVSSIRVINAMGMGSQAQIINGIIEAVDRGADVISMSLGGISNDSRQKAYQEAIDYAKAFNCIVVVAAGNSGADARNYCPANVDGVLAVGAISPDGRPAKFSNYIHNLERGIYAPGEDIYSCYPRNSYKSLSGTSMAAPYVAGFVNLLKSYDPEISLEVVYELLESSADTSQEGIRIFNPKKALELFMARNEASS